MSRLPDFHNYVAAALGVPARFSSSDSQHAAGMTRRVLPSNK